MEELDMTNDDQRALINRIVYNLIDTLSDGEKVTKNFKKLYEGGQGAKTLIKKLETLKQLVYLIYQIMSWMVIR